MIALIVILAVIFLYVIGIYNSLQTLKTQIKASIQEIGNQLKRQAGLIPNLEVAVKGQLKHEQGIYKMLTEARQSVAKADASGSAKDIDQAVAKIQNLIPQIQVVVESNPELKANEAITKFMDELTDTADKLTYARRSVIDLSQNFNEKLVVFPSNIIANIFGFKEEKGIATSTTGAHMEVSSEEEKSPKVNL
ncbi:MAG: LemA family protein [Candidatus Pacebacteria bacterium GW2011_GWF2_38_9]|nr:MAG: LemA protein, LemA protein [candidate division TM6 bacterium GW2011_GWF2_28_16]KKQ08314.1 MAG: LemA family protein [Candidatus Pacebacteria bacterium GW2011_GWF1_36_5]KKQ88917.1 MAG: LemA family protein [Candidatus Pacebacteria bacterium GW2011_GWF2_38_9]